jgi:hypothetical protein
MNETVEHGAIYIPRGERDREKRYIMNTKRER